MSAIEGFEACRARLAPLLAEAKDVLAARDGARADDLADRLAAFTNDSRPADPGDAAEVAAIAKLDALASKVADQMTALAIGGAVGDVVDHTPELLAIGQALGRLSLANVAQAKRIRLTPVRDLIERMTDTVAAAKVVAKSLDTAEPDEARIAQEIAATAERFQALVLAARAAIGGDRA